MQTKHDRHAVDGAVHALEHLRSVTPSSHLRQGRKDETDYRN